MAMDAAEHAPPRLPRLDEDAALGVNAALAALDGHVIDGLTVSVAPQTQADADSVVDQVVFSTPHGAVQVTPILADGAVFTAQDHAALLSVVSLLEPLFRMLEDAGAEALRPEGVTRVDLAGAVRITVGLADADGRALHAARLSLAATVAQQLRRVGDAPKVQDLPLPVRLQAEGPVLSPTQIGALSPGDLVLVPVIDGGWRLRLSAQGAARTAVGLFSPTTRLFTHQTKESRMTDQAPSDVAPSAASAPDLVPPLDMPVSVTVDLGETAVSLKALTGLVPGSVLPLPDLPADLAVTLSSAGRAFARGRLVSLGDAHAVLIETLAETAVEKGEAH